MILKNVYDNEMKLEFTSKSSNEAFARIAVAAFVAQLDPTIEELADILRSGTDDKKDGRRRDFTGGIFSAVSSGHGYAESL